MRYKLFILITALFLVASMQTYAAEPCRSLSGGHCLNLAAVVPGLEFLGSTPGDTGGLIARLYVFGLSLVGISALIMFVFGGVEYMTAGDNQGRVNQARSFMGNAIFGLVLALISFLILFTINPDLVTKGFPTPKAISPSQQPGVGAGVCDDAGDPRCPNFKTPSTATPPVTPTTPPATPPKTTPQFAPGG